MRKLSHTFAPVRARLAIAFGTVALLIVAPVATADASSSHNGLKSAEAVTVTKRAKTLKTVSQQTDPDKDGLSSWIEEHRTRTDPRKFDTDGDGFGDGAEVLAGSNPRSRASTPAGPPAPPPVIPPVTPQPPADTTAPNTTINSGPAGTTTSSSASLGFSSSESGSAFQCKLDSGSWVSCISPKSYRGLTGGSHTFSVKAIDAAGNSDASPATRSWTVQAATPPSPPADTTAPDTAIGSGPPATTTATSASVAFSSSESGSTFQCKLDSESWAGCTSAKAYSSLPVGAHTVSVKATDTAGNTDATPATDSWTVQSTESGGGGGASCTQTLSSGANLSTAVSSAAA